MESIKESNGGFKKRKRQRQNRMKRKNKAGYTARTVACDWAGAVMPESHIKQVINQTLLPTDGPTDEVIESRARD